MKKFFSVAASLAVIFPAQALLAQASVNVLHLAPFSDNLEDTSVNVLVNGDAALENVRYKDFVAGIELPAGASVTLYAIGDGINQPLGILAFPVGELPLRAPVDNSANGWWNILEGSGQGFILQPMPPQNRLVGTWYTYDEAANPVFLTFDSCQEDTAEDGSFECSTPGAFDGVTAETALFLSTGGGSAPNQEVVTERIGTIEFEILGCNDALAIVTLDGETPEACSGARLTQSIPCSLPQ